MPRRLLAALIVASIVASGAFVLAGSPGEPPVTAGPGGPGASPTAEPSATPVPTPTPAPPAPTPAREPPRGSTASEALGRTLQARLDAARLAAGIPGISVTIVFPDGTHWTGVSGSADVRRGTPVTAETAFAIASITKTFTAALVMDLAGAGRFALDDAVAPHLPELGLNPAITIRHLLDHTSGLRDFFSRQADVPLLAEPSIPWTAERSLSFVGPPHFRPGAGWRYSNTNYLLLGLLVERVTGRDLADLYRARFFEPLGLTGAFTQGREEPSGPLARGYRFTTAEPSETPIELFDGTAIVPFTSVVTASGGAGAIAAPSVDVARWAWLLYRDTVLPPGTVKEMVDDVALVARFQPSIPYGLGVQATRVGPFRALGHSGRFLGFRNVVRYLPAYGISIAVLTNQSRNDVGPIARDLLRLIYPTAGACRSCPEMQ